MKKLPEPYKDGITTEVKINFDWRDRIKILTGGLVTVEIFTLCEHKPGQVESKAIARVHQSLKLNNQESDIAFTQTSENPLDRRKQ